MNDRLRVVAAVVLLLPAGHEGRGQAPKEVAKSESVPSEVAGRTFDQWKADLKHPDPSVRSEAILTLLQFGAPSSEVIQLLIDRSHDRDASPRVKAIILLTMLEVPKKDVPAVVKALVQRLADDSQSIIRYQAAVALDRFADEPSAKIAIGPLLKCSEDAATWEIRKLAVALLRRVGQDPTLGPEYRISQALINAARDPTAGVRLEVAMSMGALGRPADTVMWATTEKVLQGLARDRDPVVGLWANVSLQCLADNFSEERLHAIAVYLRSPQQRMRVQAARAIGVMGTKASSAVPDLLKALDDKDSEVVFEACNALAGARDVSPKVMTALTDLSKRENAGKAVRDLAARTIEELNKPPKKEETKVAPAKEMPKKPAALITR